MSHTEEKTNMDYYDQGVTFEDIHGNVDEDEMECSEECRVEILEYHDASCPLRSYKDDAYERMVESAINIARGK